MFEGPEGSKFFSHDIKKLEGKEYFYAGQKYLWHDGPGFNTLNLHLCNLMLGMDSEDLVSFDLSTIQDEDWKENSSQVLIYINRLM